MDSKPLIQDLHRPLCFALRLPLTYCSSATGFFPSLEHTRLLPASGSLHLLISLLGTLCPMAYLGLNPVSLLLQGNLKEEVL